MNIHQKEDCFYSGSLVLCLQTFAVSKSPVTWRQANLWNTYIHKCKLQPYQQLHTLAQGIIKVMWCEMLSMWLHFSICATIAFSALLLTQREASTQEGLSYKEKVALLLRGWWKVTHSTFSSLNTVHRFLVSNNTKKKSYRDLTSILTKKNDGENICHWNYFQIPQALSELQANWPSQFS